MAESPMVGAIFPQDCAATLPGDLQHLVNLLAAHVRLFSQDKNAYAWLPRSCWKLKEKAISLAHSSEAGVRSQ